MTSRSFRWRQTNSLSRRHHEQRDYFPAVRLGPRGRWWYGGRGFKTKDALQASLSLRIKSALLCTSANPGT